jgi:hypothetical protein
MKINDVVINEAANKATWTDLLKRFSNWAVGTKFQVTADQLDKKAKNDAIVRGLADNYRNRWENIRIALQKEWNGNVNADKYKQVLYAIAVNDIGANPKYQQVQDAIKTIFDNGDRLDNDETVDAFVTLVAGGIGEKIRNQYATSQNAHVDWGGKLPLDFDFSVANQPIPAVILLTDNGKAIKANNMWFFDVSGSKELSSATATFDITDPQPGQQAAWLDSTLNKTKSSPQTQYLTSNRVLMTTKTPNVFSVLNRARSDSWANSPNRFFPDKD